MRYLLLRWLAALAWLGLCSLPKTSAALQLDQPDDPNFSGTWALDLKASTSFEPLMKQIGASLLNENTPPPLVAESSVPMKDMASLT